MRKLGFFMSTVTAAVLASTATAGDYEVTAIVGGVIPEGNLEMNKQGTIGAAVQFNAIFESIKPELELLYSPDVVYKKAGGETTITRVMLNGVHEYGPLGTAIPYMKAGLGYENMTKLKYDNEDSVMADAGLGFKFPIAEEVALKLEALYMLKYNDDRWDNNLAVLAGVNVAFGASEPAAEPAPEPAPAVADAPADSDNDGVADDADKCPGTAAGVSVDANGCALDSDSDGVVDGTDKCPDTPAGATVDAMGCQLDGDHDGVVDASDKCPDTPKGASVDELGCAVDSDGDGVSDLKDNCPNTPEGFKVDMVGCPVVKTLKIRYETASAVIAKESEGKVVEFAEFLKESPAYNVKILGHTDSRGSDKYNQGLSEARANSVRTLLIANGISEDRIIAEGKGESQPIADNGTKEGRAANRRIEVWLLK
ncbi:OmpA family protein [Sulfurimonas diazotrophicus]|uniref:OmpA family protein n=1 Tax=Sulfurimonas diazotrophicus TaxID=3131939 RepID=A0ABZ3HAC3_9BACT